MRCFVKRGRHPSKKTAFTVFLKSMTRGKTPIEKNIAVVDEQGNQYEATWPKRARGLVKNGRARFISENKICLACPPNIILEDVAMSDRMINEANAGAVHNGGVDGQFGRGYILKQIDKILEQKDYLFEAIKGLSNMSDGENGETDSPGNLLGQAKADALKDIVCSRESTHQQMLKLYEQMYFDLRKEGL